MCTFAVSCYNYVSGDVTVYLDCHLPMAKLAYCHDWVINEHPTCCWTVINREPKLHVSGYCRAAVMCAEITKWGCQSVSQPKQWCCMGQILSWYILYICTILVLAVRFFYNAGSLAGTLWRGFADHKMLGEPSSTNSGCSVYRVSLWFECMRQVYVLCLLWHLFALHWPRKLFTEPDCQDGILICVVLPSTSKAVQSLREFSLPTIQGGLLNDSTCE